ncbi:MAG: hypothetical protein MUD08_01245 [Cytophagales bacterium]|jgi:hypothetical protein|nr:hypothetical protein [Cytophagales bacterium]
MKKPNLKEARATFDDRALPKGKVEYTPEKEAAIEKALKEIREEMTQWSKNRFEGKAENMNDGNAATDTQAAA